MMVGVMSASQQFEQLSDKRPTWGNDPSSMAKLPNEGLELVSCAGFPILSLPQQLQLFFNFPLGEAHGHGR